MKEYKNYLIALVIGIVIGGSYSLLRKPEIKMVIDTKIEEELKKQLDVYKNIEKVTQEEFNCSDGKLSSRKTILKDNSVSLLKEEAKTKTEIKEVITQNPKPLLSLDLGLKYDTINLDKFKYNGFGIGLNINHNIKILPKRLTQDFDNNLKPQSTTLWWEVWELK